MASASERIAAAAPRNAELLATLSKTDYAPAALKQQNAFIADLQASLKQTDATIAKLDQTVKKELKDHEKYRDSTVKRFASKLGGKKSQAKFEEKASKEEKEYFDAVYAKKAAEDERAMLKTQLADAEKVRVEYDSALKTHKDAQEELNEMYEGIFAGPTPDFPDEDPKELAVYEAEKKRNDAQEKLSKSTQAAQCMIEADKVMGYAQTAMGSALNYSTWDVWGGGSFADIAERNALADASSAAQRSLMLVAQAQRLDSAIKHPGQVNIAQGNILSDVLFDNIFTDLAFHEKIKESAINLRIAHQRLAEQRQLVGQRLQSLKVEVEQAEGVLRQARDELQNVRQRAFEQVEAARPPAYTVE